MVKAVHKNPPMKAGCVIGAGNVGKNIFAVLLSVGHSCIVLRLITEEDRIALIKLKWQRLKKVSEVMLQGS